MIEVGTLIAVIGCFVGLAGWLSGRERKVQSSAEKRGEMSAKLDTILTAVTGLRTDHDKLEKRVNEQGERLATVEASAKQAHHRLDEITKR